MLRRRQRGNPGQTLVETALVLPLLGVLIFGCIDCSRYVAVRATLQSHARDAARVASLEAERGTDCAVVAAASASGGGMTFAVDPASTWNGGAAPAGSPSPDQGLIFIHPAVAQTTSPSLPGCTAAAGHLRPSGPVSVTITEQFLPWTPLVGFFTGPLTITAQAQVEAEY